MTDKPTNRVYDDDSGDDKPKKGPKNQASFNFNGQNFTFGFVPQGDDIVMNTPFGVIKLSVNSSDDIGEINEELQKLFNHDGLSMEKLHELISQLPPIQELFGQMPQLKDMLEQAFASMAGATKASAPKGKKPKTKSTRQPLQQEDLTFERFYKQQYPN